MTLHDARLPAWSLAGTAGGTIVLRCEAVPDALASTTVSLWLGGSTRDVNDLTDATEIRPTAIDGDEWVWTISVPAQRDPVPLRWTVDGVPATVGALIPSRIGALVHEEDVRLAVGAVEVHLSVPVAAAPTQEDGRG